MPSAIDPTRPLDGIPASKAELRANLTAAKLELDHGGFAEGLSPINYGPPVSSRTTDHLQAIDDALGGRIGASAFADLIDTPSEYIGQANRYTRVKANETGLEFVEQAAGGDASTTSYTAPGTGAITRSVREKLGDVISVKDFGAKGDGVADDTQAFTSAFNAAYDIVHPGPELWQALKGRTAHVTGAVIFLPPGMYRLRNFTIDKPVTVIGSGKASRLWPTQDCASGDYIMKVVLGQHDYRNGGNHNPGVFFQNFMFEGLGRSIDCGGLLLEQIDHSLLSLIHFEEIKETAMRIAKSVREQSYSDLHFKFCGGALFPAVDLYDDDASLDAHNNMHFSRCYFVYPVGDNVRIGGNPVNASPVRNIFFNQCMFHGLTNTNLASRETPTRHLVVTRVNHLHMGQCRLHAWGTGAPCIYLSHEAGEDPLTGTRATDLTLMNSNFGKHNDGLGTNGDPDINSPHVRIDAAGIFSDIANIAEGTSALVVDRVGGIGTYRRYEFTTNPV